MSHCKTS